MARFTGNTRRKAERLNGTLLFIVLLIVLLIAAWWIGNPTGFEDFLDNINTAFRGR